MKRIVKHTTILLTLALYVALGMGFNTYNYCCECCASVGYNMFSTTSCEEVHRTHQCEHSHCTHVPYKVHNGDTELSTTGKHCSVERHTITQINNIQDFTCSAQWFVFTTHLLQNTIAVAKHNIPTNKPRKSPPPKLDSGREILLSSSILII